MADQKNVVGILLLGLWLVLGGFGGCQAGRWYGSYQYRDAQRREGIIGNLALAASNQEEKLRAESGKEGAIWGVILALVVFANQDRARNWMKRLMNAETGN
jgi:hypothetical protein